MAFIKNFFNYLFSANPGVNFRYYVPLIILVALLIGGSIALSVIYKKKRKDDFAFKRLFKKTSNRLLLFGILFLFLVLVRYENIPYFSMRIWLYLSLLLLAYFLYRTLRVYRVDYPREKHNAAPKITTHKEEKQYLPNKKKR